MIGRANFMRHQKHASTACEPPLGAVIVCEIYQLFDHTGIYIGDGQIVELAGTGLVRAVSFCRFLHGRSGEDLQVLVDTAGRPLGFAEAAGRAISALYTYRPYDVLRYNCHRFCLECIDGRVNDVTSFFDFKTAIQQRTQIQVDIELLRWRPPYN